MLRGKFLVTFNTSAPSVTSEGQRQHSRETVLVNTRQHRRRFDSEDEIIDKARTKLEGEQQFTPGAEIGEFVKMRRIS